MSERQLTQALHSRGFTVLMMVVAIVLTIIARNSENFFPLGSSSSFLFASPSTWIKTSGVSLGVNLIAIFALAFIANTILKTFNPMRVMSSLWATLFIVIQTSLPSVISTFSSGTFLTLALTASMMILFSCYNAPDYRSIFLAFFVLSLASTFQFSFILYLPVLFLGLIQFKVADIRGFLASILGIATPYWFIFGCGIRHVDQLVFPDFSGSFSLLNSPEAAQTLTVIGLTAVVGISFLAANMMRMLSYNSQMRSYNGFIALMLIATILFILLDYQNWATFIPQLSFLTAYQICFFFSVHRKKRSYIPILLIIFSYFALYAWSLAV